MKYHKFIYLQVKDNEGNEIDPLEEPGWTWCQDSIEQSDVEYVNANLVQHLFDVLRSSEQTLNNLGMGELTGEADPRSRTQIGAERDAYSFYKKMKALDYAYEWLEVTATDRNKSSQSEDDGLLAAYVAGYEQAAQPRVERTTCQYCDTDTIDGTCVNLKCDGGIDILLQLLDV